MASGCVWLAGQQGWDGEGVRLRQRVQQAVGS